jgi:hypothetical protein
MSIDRYRREAFGLSLVYDVPDHLSEEGAIKFELGLTRAALQSVRKSRDRLNRRNLYLQAGLMLALGHIEQVPDVSAAAKRILDALDGCLPRNDEEARPCPAST